MESCHADAGQGGIAQTMDNGAQSLTESSQDPSEGGGEYAPWSFVIAVVRWRSLVVGSTLVAAAVVSALTLLPARDYSASASFVAQDRRSSPSGFEQLALQFGVALPLTGGAVTPQFYADLLQSRGILSEVLSASYSSIRDRPYLGSLFRYLSVDPDSGGRAMRVALRKIRKMVAIRLNRSTSVVRLEVTSRIPALSEEITNRLLDLLNNYNLQRRQSQARAEREFVEGRLAVYGAELAAAEDELVRFYRQNRYFANSPELKAEEGRLQRAVSLRQQLYVSLTQSYEAAKIEEVRNTPVFTVLDRPQGSVEPTDRNIAGKLFVGAFTGALIGLAVALAIDYAKRARLERPEQYEELVRAFRQGFTVRHR